MLLLSSNKPGRSTCLCPPNPKKFMKIKSTTNSLTGVILLVAIAFASCKKDQNILADPASDLTASPDKVASVSPTESLQTVGAGTFFIVNRLSGKMLDVSGQATANGTSVIQWPGTGGTNQRWTLAPVTGGYYSVTGVQSGKALDIVSSGTANGDNAEIYTYSSGTQQQWQFVSLANGYYQILNRNSGKSLQVEAASMADGAAVDQSTYTGAENQQWALFTPVFNGQLTWRLTSTGVPADVLARITTAMNDACARYNAGANWPARTLTVEYNTGVATADGSTSGNIRFGPTASYQAVRTAMHEIAHTYGVGISSGFNSNVNSSGDFTGANAVAVLATFDGVGAVLHTGGSHIWPYGLNYDNEWSEAAAYRQVKIIWAMRADGM